MRSGDGLRRRRAGSGDGAESAPRTPTISIESFDLYTKVRDEETVHSSSGATVSLIVVLISLILVASEMWKFLVPVKREHMNVDPIIEGRLQINFDFTFPALQCSEVNLDAMDVAGEQQNGIDHDMTKTRLSASGAQIGDAFAHRMDENSTAEAPLPEGYCGSCFGAQSHEGQCCNTCDELRSAYADRGWDVAGITHTSEQCAREHRNSATTSLPGEGCRLSGHMWVNKVAGNFHIAMGETHQRGAGHIHQFNPMALTSFNVSHVIHSLSFGESYPGIVNPLDDTTRMVGESTGVFMYFAKIIPTVYKGRGGPSASPVLITNQYSITSQFRPAVVGGMRMNVLPGIFFIYELSPFQVTVTEHTQTFAQLVTSLCAILGGVITAAGLLDSALFYVQKRLGVKTLWDLVMLLGSGHAKTTARIPATPTPASSAAPSFGARSPPPPPLSVSSASGAGSSPLSSYSASPIVAPTMHHPHQQQHQNNQHQQ